MKRNQRQLLADIGKESVRLDWEKAFDGKAYGNRHLFRVNKIAKHLLRREGGSSFIALAGAWVHDISLVLGNDDDPHKIASFTKKFLQGFAGLTEKDISLITTCAAGHEAGGSILSLEAKIVHDADVVDKSGMLGIVRHVWKMTNMIKNRILSDQADLVELQEHLKQREAKVFTATAKELAAKLNKERDSFFQNRELALGMMKRISLLAMQGITSDKISRKITRGSKYPCLLFLRSQLNCEYLR